LFGRFITSAGVAAPAHYTPLRAPDVERDVPDGRVSTVAYRTKPITVSLLKSVSQSVRVAVVLLAELIL
jgi:hypothetical protein